MDLSPHDLTKSQVTAKLLGGHVYLIQSSETDAGNIAALVSSEGTLLVDAQYAQLAARVKDALQELPSGGSSVRFLIDTHYHFDHTGGNAAFGGTGTIIIAHEAVRERFIRTSVGGNGADLHFRMSAIEPAGRPTIAFDHELTVHLDAEEVQIVNYGHAHTDGDVIVYFHAAHVVHMGDIYVRYGFPFIDVQAGGSIDGMIRVCNTVLATSPGNTKIIPGHGDVASLAELRNYLQMLTETRDVIKTALMKGKSALQMKQERLLAKWSTAYANDFVSTDAYIDTLYSSLKQRETSESPRNAVRQLQ